MTEQKTTTATAVVDWPDCLDTSLMKAQLEFPDIPKDKINKFYDSQPYSSLDAIVSMTRPSLAKFGLVASHKVEDTESGVRVTAILKHVVTKEQDTNSLSCGCDRNNPQKMGSAITYLRRYTIAPLLGVTPDEDDDGNSAIPDDKRREAANGSRQPPANGRKPPHGSAPSATKEVTIPPNWPESNVAEIGGWITGLPCNVAFFATALGLFESRAELVANFAEWEAVTNAFFGRVKFFNEQHKAQFWKAPQPVIDKFVSDAKRIKAKLDLDRDSPICCGGDGPQATPAQGTESHGEEIAQ